jgi:hypothetical protein
LFKNLAAECLYCLDAVWLCVGEMPQFFEPKPGATNQIFLLSDLSSFCIVPWWSFGECRIEIIATSWCRHVHLVRPTRLVRG